MAVRTTEEGREPSGRYVTMEEFLRWKKEFQEYKARNEEREQQREKLIEQREELIEEREKMVNKFWKERAVYIAIIVGSISILLTIIMMLIR